MQAGLALYWWQRLITLCGRIRVNEVGANLVLNCQGKICSWLTLSCSVLSCPGVHVLLPSRNIFSVSTDFLGNGGFSSNLTGAVELNFVLKLKKF